MSILLAYKKEGAIYMGTDTRIVVNDNKKSALSRCDLKIQKLENGILLGIAGERLERQTIIAYSEIFTLDKEGKLTRKHIVKEIVPRLIEMLEEENLMMKKEEEFPYVQAQILLAYKDTLYEICSGFTVIKYEDFQALGRDCDYAIATLMNTKPTDDIKKRLIKALDISAKYSQYIGKPYVLIDTKSMDYEYVMGEGYELKKDLKEE